MTILFSDSSFLRNGGKVIVYGVSDLLGRNRWEFWEVAALGMLPTGRAKQI